MLEKHAKKFKEMQVILGEKLTPLYGEAIHKASTLLDVFTATTEFLLKYGASLVPFGTLIVAYTLLTKALVFWETRKNEQAGIGLLLSKLQTIAYHAQFAAIALYNAGVALLTGNLKQPLSCPFIFRFPFRNTPGLAFCLNHSTYCRHTQL